MSPLPSLFLLSHLLTLFDSNSFQTLELINTAVPFSANTRISFDGQPYELVFSDEFALEKRFYYADGPHWESVDI
jgi:hypothetical protein